MRVRAFFVDHEIPADLRDVGANRLDPILEAFGLLVDADDTLGDTVELRAVIVFHD